MNKQKQMSIDLSKANSYASQVFKTSSAIGKSKNDLAAEYLAEAGYINGADFVEWLKHSDYMQANVLKSNYGISKILTSVSYADLDKALQEYLKGE